MVNDDRQGNHEELSADFVPIEETVERLTESHCYHLTLISEGGKFFHPQD